MMMSRKPLVLNPYLRIVATADVPMPRCLDAVVGVIAVRWRATVGTIAHCSAPSIGEANLIWNFEFPLKYQLKCGRLENTPGPTSAGQAGVSGR